MGYGRQCGGNRHRATASKTWEVGWKAKEAADRVYDAEDEAIERATALSIRCYRVRGSNAAVTDAVAQRR